MRHLFLFAAALLMADSAFAVDPDLAELQYSDVQQDVGGDLGCVGDFDASVYNGRWDVTLPAGGGHEQTVVHIDPSFQWDSFGGDTSDPEERQMAVYIASMRLQAMAGLLRAHRECARGGQKAQDGCISMGQVERAMDKFTDEGRALRTYKAPYEEVALGTGDTQRVFNQLRYFWWEFGQTSSQTYRQRLARHSFEPRQNRRWLTPETAGEVAGCTECRERIKVDRMDHIYVPPMASDYDIASPAQVKAATLAVLAGPAVGEFVLDNEGKVFVPRCPIAQ